MPHRPVVLLALLTVFLAAVCGCGPSRPARVKVSGRVLVDGKPLDHGVVQFHHPAARASYGEIGKDGRFTLSCFDEGDGCVPGTHRVTVTANKSLGPTAIRWDVPKKYVDPETTDLVEEIQEPTDNLVIELSWDGGKPYVEQLGEEGEPPP